MRRLIGGLFAAAVLVVAAVPGGLLAQGAGKTMNTTGVVSAVTPGSIAIKVKAEEMKFVVDKDTAVMAKGAHSQEPRDEGGRQVHDADRLREDR